MSGSEPPAGLSGDAARAAWRKALADLAKTSRRHAPSRAVRQARRVPGGQYRAGANRRPPPEPDGNNAA